MSRVDRINRCLELKIVFWGPAGAGKTTALRSLHGACDVRRRGEFASVSADRGREASQPGSFDFVPLELPRFRDYDLRVDSYTVPGFAGYEATRRRLLRGADGVIFVADVSPAGIDGNVESWQALDRLLRVGEANEGQPTPVVALANKSDVTGARDATHLKGQLLASCGRRPLLGAVDAVARSGTGVLQAFRDVVLAAAARALEPLESMHLTGGNLADTEPPEEDTRTRRFLDSFYTQFGGLEDGVPVEATDPGRAVSVAFQRTVPPAPQEPGPDARQGGSREGPRERIARDAERRERRRDATLGRLLVDVAHVCASATDEEGAARSVLIQIVMNLDAVSGWVGLADDRDGEAIYDSMGRARDGGAVAEAAQALSVGLVDDTILPVGEAATAGFPGGAAGGRGVFLQFPVSGGEPGWMLLVGPPGRGLPADAEPALRTAGAILGLTVARLHALAQLRTLNRALEQKVAERTAELRREKETLEDRVRERTRELEKTKRAALETERKLYDRGREEGVQQVAAGVAHELNNPLSSVSVNLQVALEVLEEATSEQVRDAAWLKEAIDAVRDAASEAEQAATRVSSLFGRDVAASRRAAVCTNLHDAVHEALDHFRQVFPETPEPVVSGPTDVTTGIQQAELTRWIFRSLSGLASSLASGAHLRVSAGPEGPLLYVDLDGAEATGSAESLTAIADEVRAAGGRLEARLGSNRCRVEFLLPPAVGARGTDELWERSA